MICEPENEGNWRNLHRLYYNPNPISVAHDRVTVDFVKTFQVPDSGLSLGLLASVLGAILSPAVNAQEYNERYRIELKTGTLQLGQSQFGELSGSVPDVELSSDPSPEIELFSDPAPELEPSSTTDEAEEESATSDPAEEEALHETIITLTELPNAEEIEAYRQRNINLGQYIDGTSYYATAPLSAFKQAAQDESIRSIIIPPVEHKIDPELLTAQPLATENSEGTGAEEASVDVTVELTGIGTFEGAAEAIETLGGEVIEVSRAARALTARLPQSNASALAVSPDIRFVAPAPGAPEAFNDGVRANIGADDVEAKRGLVGNGIVVGVWDGGSVDAHGDFTGRLTVAEPTAPADAHATHVAGTLGGNGSGSVQEDQLFEPLVLAGQREPGGTATAAGDDSEVKTPPSTSATMSETSEIRALPAGEPGQWRGVAPSVGIVSFYWDTPADDHNSAIGEYNIDISQNSWGFGVNEALNKNCSQYGDYTGGPGGAAAYDRIVRGLFGRPIPVVFAVGNERNDADCGMAPPPADNFANITPPQTAKNVITVGAINSDDDTLTEFTSFGPTDDGRLKPDVVTAGCEQGGTGRVTSTALNGGYNGNCGTSMAAPAVSGVIAILMEARQQAGAAVPLLPSSYKALLVHSAQDIDAVGPDFRTGYGKVDAPAALALQEGSAVTEAEIRETGHHFAAQIVVGENAARLTATLAWDDVPGVPNAVVSLVNDLDLWLVGPDGVTYMPWVLDPLAPDASATRGRDTVNVLEQVRVNNPTAGAWQIIIAGTRVPVPRQPFSLVVSQN